MPVSTRSREYYKGIPTGVELRDFDQKSRKSGVFPWTEAARLGGLYYLRDPGHTHVADKMSASEVWPPNENSSKGMWDAQIKIGLAGQGKTPEQVENERYGISSSTSTITGRMGMYRGHRGSLPMYMQAFRAMPTGNPKNVGNRKGHPGSRKRAEEIMKTNLKEVAENHPGIEVNRKAYAYDKEKGSTVKQTHNQNNPEWFLVDYDVPDKRGMFPQEAILRSMVLEPKLKNAKQDHAYDVSKRKPVEIKF